MVEMKMIVGEDIVVGVRIMVDDGDWGKGNGYGDIGIMMEKETMGKLVGNGVMIGMEMMVG